ncbi:hypothetical protein GCM10023324_43040 [Streptomyces youssoufiensis]
MREGIRELRAIGQNSPGFSPRLAGERARPRARAGNERAGDVRAGNVRAGTVRAGHRPPWGGAGAWSGLGARGPR